MLRNNIKLLFDVVLGTIVYIIGALFHTADLRMLKLTKTFDLPCSAVL